MTKRNSKIHSAKAVFLSAGSAADRKKRKAFGKDETRLERLVSSDSELSLHNTFAGYVRGRGVQYLPT